MRILQFIILVLGLMTLHSCGSSKKTAIITESMPESQRLLEGNWVLATIDQQPIDRSIVLPTMQMDIEQNLLSGSGGCNNYSGSMTFSENRTLVFGTVASTRKMCNNQNIETEYYRMLSQVNTYQLLDGSLTFYNVSGDEIAKYMKQKDTTTNQRIHDIWVVKSINGNTVTRNTEAPRVEINLTTMRVMGNDSCNEYSGAIKSFSDDEIVFGQVAATRMMCPDMDVANTFNKALLSTKSYNLDGLNLYLLDSDGQELLKLLKVD